MAKIKLTLKKRPDFSQPVPEADEGPAKEVAIRDEYIKLDSFLKFSGALLSGGEAKEQVQAGKVTVNGEVCTMRGKKLRPGDTVSCGGKNYTVTAQ